MKWIKKIVIGLFVLLLINFISILTLSFIVKSILVDGIIKESIVQSVTKKDYNDNSIEIDEKIINQVTDDERVRKLLELPETQELINKYFEITMNEFIEGESLDEVELEKDIIQYLKDNKEEIESIVGQKITDEMIEEVEKQAEGKDLSKAYVQSISNTSNSLGKGEKMILKGFNQFTSNGFRFVLVLLILIDIIFIALFQESFHRWIKTFGKSLITSGFLLVAMSLFVAKVVLSIAKYHFNTSILLNSGIILVIIGFIIVITYNIICFIIEKMRKEDENYEVS